MKIDYLIVGAGFAGSVLAERIASQLNKKVLVVEKRHHIGGNAYDEFDEYGVLVHRYGPHIFHTNSKGVFDYLSKYTEWIPYEHKVMARLGDELYPIPINKLTINKLFNKNFRTEKEVLEFYDSLKEKRYPIENSEDVIVNQVGYELFEKFFKYYTKKQWNLFPNELSPSVCGRIPVRTNEDCRYFTDKYQYMPKYGYTKMFENILSNKNIEVALETDYKNIMNDIKFDKMIYTGPIDYFFDYEFGKLPYRSIDFKLEHHHLESYQEPAVVNFVDPDINFTRVTEYKKLTQQQTKNTTISKEFSSDSGEPFYSIPNEQNRRLFKEYYRLTSKIPNVLFCGRLAEYQYYNMDQVVAKSLKVFMEISKK